MILNKNVVVSDSGFVFNSKTGESFSVNPIGVEIIEMLKQKLTIEDINKRILSKYNTDIVTVEREIDEFIDMLKQYSLINNQDEFKEKAIFVRPDYNSSI